MAIDKQEIIRQIQEQSNLLDNLIDSDDIVIAQESLKLNRKTEDFIRRLNRAGLDLSDVLKRNEQNKEKLETFLREFG